MNFNSSVLNFGCFGETRNEVLKRVVGRDATATLHGSMTAHTPWAIAFPLHMYLKKAAVDSHAEVEMKAI